MRINFEKEIKGIDALKDYTITKDPIYERGRRAYYQDYLSVDKESVKKSLVDRLEQDLRNHEHLVKRSSPSSLWVSEPNPFSLVINIPHIISDGYEQVGIKSIDFWWGVKKKVPIYRSMICIPLNGVVAYKQLEKVDLNPVLDILQDQGYNAQIITTEQQVLEIIKRAKEKAEGSSEEFLASSDDSSWPLSKIIIASAILGGED